MSNYLSFYMSGRAQVYLGADFDTIMKRITESAIAKRRSVSWTIRETIAQYYGWDHDNTLVAKITTMAIKKGVTNAKIIKRALLQQ